jgi:hypothetical protein
LEEKIEIPDTIISVSPLQVNSISTIDGEAFGARSRRETPGFSHGDLLITLTPAFGGIFDLALPDGALPPIKGEGATLPFLGINHAVHALAGGE